MSPFCLGLAPLRLDNQSLSLCQSLPACLPRALEGKEALGTRGFLPPPAGGLSSHQRPEHGMTPGLVSPPATASFFSAQGQ